MPKKLMAIRLPIQQIKRLEALSAKTGSSVAELIRRAIDATYPPPEVKEYVK